MNHQSENLSIEMPLDQIFFRIFLFFAFCISLIYTYELFQQRQTESVTNQASEASKILSKEIFQEVKIITNLEQIKINEKKMKDSQKNLKHPLLKKDGLPVFQVNSFEKLSH